MKISDAPSFAKLLIIVAFTFFMMLLGSFFWTFLTTHWTEIGAGQLNRDFVKLLVSTLAITVVIFLVAEMCDSIFPQSGPIRSLSVVYLIGGFVLSVSRSMQLLDKQILVWYLLIPTLAISFLIAGKRLLYGKQETPGGNGGSF